MQVDAAASSANVTGAIRQAARLTGANFGYLLATAQVESRLNPGAQAPTSSASGLFQFIEQTWLATLKQAGNAFGYGKYAAAIAHSPSGGYQVSDPAMHREIMALRKDPTANAVMAGIFTRQNAARLGDRLGRAASEGELYIAHFLGPTGATRLINAASEKPAARAIDLFPAAGRSNRSIFYDKAGRARSVSQVYAALVGRYQTARAGANPVLAAAAPEPVRASAPQPSRQSAPLVASAPAAATPETSVPQDGPVFHSLFQTGTRREAVAPVVNELWTGLPPARPSSAPANPVASAFDVLQSARPDLRRLFSDG
jgi:hypothetical protein